MARLHETCHAAEQLDGMFNGSFYLRSFVCIALDKRNLRHESRSAPFSLVRDVNRLAALYLSKRGALLRRLQPPYVVAQ